MIKKLYESWNRLYSRLSLRYVIWGAFTITALVAGLLMGTSFYSRFSAQSQKAVERQNGLLLEQVNTILTSDLRNMMKISDSLYFSVIKDGDIESIAKNDGFQLLYDTNKDSIENITLFSTDGELLVASPAAVLKGNIHVKEDSWFKAALAKPENLHFTNPHIQNLFVRSDFSYERVVSLSRAVSITKGNEVENGILLIDIKYEKIEQILDKVTLGEKGYIYLTDSEGEIIYHPKQQLIADGLEGESNLKLAKCKDGVYEDIFGGEERQVTIKSVGYTGWKMVGVVSSQAVPLATTKSFIFFIALVLLFMFVLSIINSYISAKVTSPIKRLESSVKKIESGDLEAVIDERGCYEIRHLGHSIEKMKIQMNKLMKDIVKEHESQRKNELNTLQSQINPHFLYNTLDIVVWMVENEKPEEAVRALTALARFFRIGLSKGNTIISVRDEIEHVENYLTIQKMRYKNKFEYQIELDEDVKNMATLKLILQPLVENAISYGMEFKDGDGKILIRGYKEQGDVILEVEDNGLGMPPQRAEELRKGQIVPSKKGSGIGIKNVNERIQLCFGEAYGLSIYTEPDEGTIVTIRQPAEGIE